MGNVLPFKNDACPPKLGVDAPLPLPSVDHDTYIAQAETTQPITVETTASVAPKRKSSNPFVLEEPYTTETTTITTTTTTTNAAVDTTANTTTSTEPTTVVAHSGRSAHRSHVEFSYFQTFPEDTGLYIYFSVNNSWLETVCDGIERTTIVHAVKEYTKKTNKSTFHAQYARRTAPNTFQQTHTWTFMNMYEETQFYYAPVVYVNRTEIYHNVWVIVETIPSSTLNLDFGYPSSGGQRNTSFLGSLWQMFTGSHTLRRTPTRQPRVGQSIPPDGTLARIHLLTNDGRRKTIDLGYLFATPLNR